MNKITLTTTLKALKKADACQSGLGTLVASLPKTHSETTFINLLHILKSNGIDHFFWAWRATTKKALKIKRMILHDILLEIEHLHPDPEVFKQVLIALRTGRKLNSAADAAACTATYAARAATYAARAADAAAYAAADAATYAATYAARAADAAADAAACTAACTATYAAYDAARTKQIEIIKKYLK